MAWNEKMLLNSELKWFNLLATEAAEAAVEAAEAEAATACEAVKAEAKKASMKSEWVEQMK